MPYSPAGWPYRSVPSLAADGQRLRPSQRLFVLLGRSFKRPHYPMEDDAYLTENGYVYFRPYQTKWYLIR